MIPIVYAMALPTFTFTLPQKKRTDKSAQAIAAEKAGRKIAVEVKSFASGSAISKFHTAFGQFLNYRIALEASEEPDRILYLVVPRDVYQTFLRFESAKTVVERY